MAPTDAGSPLATLVAAWSSSADDVLALAGTLDEAEMAAATDLPGWTVQDVIAHLAALEAELAGDPVPEVPDEQIPSDALADPFRACRGIQVEPGARLLRRRGASQRGS